MVNENVSQFYELAHCQSRVARHPGDLTEKKCNTMECIIPPALTKEVMFVTDD